MLVAGGDSGELVAEGCILGTAHPPGYPLFTVGVYLAQLVNLGSSSIAYKVNLSGAFLTTASASLMAVSLTNIITIINMKTIEKYSSICFCMTMFSFSPLIWQYANTAEVFPLNTFFASLLVFLVTCFANQALNYCQFKKKQNDKVMNDVAAMSLDLWIIYLGAFICGLSLCNQHTIILFEG